jgi:hypothetical protein
LVAPKVRLYGTFIIGLSQLLMYQNILESKQKYEEEKRKKREKETEEKRQKTTKEQSRKTSSYCKEQDWKISI